MKPTTVPHPIEHHVGARMRERREALGLSQSQLADALGVTLAQIEKYEQGRGRMLASRLFRAARALDVPLIWFFQELDPDSL